VTRDNILNSTKTECMGGKRNKVAQDRSKW
jgi:hypothetical protein